MPLKTAVERQSGDCNAGLHYRWLELKR